MVFSSKEIADYTETINSYLDRIPICNLRDFDKVIYGLTLVLGCEKVETDDKAIIGNRRIKREISGIKGMVHSPELWVANPELDGEYKALIMNQVISKVNELSAMSLVAKETYIANQKERRERALVNQALVQAAGNIPRVNVDEGYPNLEIQFLDENVPVSFHLSFHHFATFSQNPPTLIRHIDADHNLEIEINDAIQVCQYDAIKNSENFISRVTSSDFILFFSFEHRAYTSFAYVVSRQLYENLDRQLKEIINRHQHSFAFLMVSQRLRLEDLDKEDLKTVLLDFANFKEWLDKGYSFTWARRLYKFVAFLDNNFGG